MAFKGTSLLWKVHWNGLDFKPRTGWRNATAHCGRFAESFRQRLVRQRLRWIRQRPKSPCQRPTGQFANVRYLVLTETKLLIDVCFGEN